MAKPTGRSIYAARPTTIGKQHQESHQLSAQRPRRHSRTIGAVACPSSGVLSLLATIAATCSAADGSPLVAQPTPPSFLCPFIERDNCYENPDAPSDTNIAKRFPVILPPTPARNQHRVVQIADKFEEGSDGKWRKVDVYTLYGSTVCLQNCVPTSTHIDANNVVNSATPIPTPSSSTKPGSGDKYAATMPTGWNTSRTFDKSRTTVILSISLILAFLICVFMAGCIIWRRKKRRISGNDEEMKLRKRRNEDASEQEKLMKEAHMKQKFWARASARWKAHTQLSARRRTNRRLIAAVHSISASLHDNTADSVSLRGPCSGTSSVHSSRLPSPRSSLSSHRSTTHDNDHTTQGPSNSPLTADPEAPLPPAYIHTSPPLIQRKHSHPDEFYLRTDHDPSDPFSQDSHNSNEEQPEYTFCSDDDPIPYDNSYYAGHVATDDKTLLARMATMASAPPSGLDEGESSVLQTSVPVWEDERLEDITNDLDDNDIGLSPTSSPPPPLASCSAFPPPPPKHNLVAPHFYDHPYSFEEDIHSLEPEAGPSAPPFEEHLPSAPPLEDAEGMPSASPLLEDLVPSAPDWHLQDDEGGQDHDREEGLPQHSPRASSTSIPNNGVLPSYPA